MVANLTWNFHFPIREVPQSPDGGHPWRKLAPDLEEQVSVCISGKCSRKLAWKLMRVLQEDKGE